MKNIPYLIFIYLDGEVLPEYIRRCKDICEMGPNHSLHSIVMSCLENEPVERPSASELVQFLERFKTGDSQTNIQSMHCSKLSVASGASPVKLDGKFDRPSGNQPLNVLARNLTRSRYEVHEYLTKNKKVVFYRRFTNLKSIKLNKPLNMCCIINYNDEFRLH